MRAIEIIATVFMALAIIHTFLAGRFKAWAHHFEEGSVPENLFHLLGETEVVFGLWAAAFCAVFALVAGGSEAIAFVEGRKFAEPIFVCAIMTMASTKPILDTTKAAVSLASRTLVFLPKEMRFYTAALVAGPLLGSLITEPAAMTITALLLANTFYRKGPSRQFMYGTVGLLFVNVSIGGTLTNFAAPPIVMVAGTWGWDTSYVFSHFGIRAAIAVIANTVLSAIWFRKELARLGNTPDEIAETLDVIKKAPAWVVIVHAAFIVATVLFTHHPTIVVGILLFFLGVTQVTKEYQAEVRLKEGALVGFFLGGLVVLGSYQAWWISPLITSLGPTPLYFGATALTAITDNALLTYLASTVQNLSETVKYAVVAGAVSGGGLTVIANAPNPAGYSILKDYFENKAKDLEFSAIGLFIGALGPTIVACTLFYGDKLFSF